MKNTFRVMFIVLIVLMFVGCASTSENTSHLNSSGNYILLGFWHGIILPFATLGKLLGLNIGLIHREYNSSISYLLGYVLALILYLKAVLYIWNGIRQYRGLKQHSASCWITKVFASLTAINAVLCWIFTSFLRRFFCCCMNKENH